LFSFSGRIFCGEPVPTSPENALTVSLENAPCPLWAEPFPWWRTAE
jgi:hypothetical protein